MPPMRVWSFLTLVITLVCVAAVMYGLTAFLMARILTRPPRLTDARALARLNRMSPADIGLEFTDCRFEARDQHTDRLLSLADDGSCGRSSPSPGTPGEGRGEGSLNPKSEIRNTKQPQKQKYKIQNGPHTNPLPAYRARGQKRLPKMRRTSLSLSGWWIPKERSDRCVLLIHGYADAKIGAIAWAPMMLGLGWNVLAIDLRAHGESGGRDTTAGYFERHDVNQVLDQLKLQRPGLTKQIAILGMSMGAAVAAAVAETRTDLRGIILDSPYARFRDAATTHASLTGLPGESFVKTAWPLSQWLTGASFDEVDPIHTIPKAKCPVLVISAGQDRLIDAKGRADLRAAVMELGNRGLYWQVEAAHVHCLPAEPDAYCKKIAEFLDVPVTPHAS